IETSTRVNIAYCALCSIRQARTLSRVWDHNRDQVQPSMKTAPSILDYLNDYSQDYFNKVKKYLDAMNISYVIDPTLVRGLDYYNHTAFEIMSDHEGFGAITTLLGGGRYNGLTSELGGLDVLGIGVGMGLERLMLAL